MSLTKFTGLDGEPVYIDRSHVVAVVQLPATPATEFTTGYPRRCRVELTNKSIVMVLEAADIVAGDKA